MMDLQRDTLMRYLHERGEMSLQERFGVEWRLLTSSVSRKEYSEMEQMHRALSFHFAPSAAVVLPEPRTVWLRVGIAGLTGAVAVAGSLLWLQETRPTERGAVATTVVATPASHCPRCSAIKEHCTHCTSAAKATREGCAPR
ncbi:MAG: hypothetical protein H8F28_04015 [Fibrella sp.]|nr:hypothetical protein [Armatimonadota bacterium]